MKQRDLATLSRELEGHLYAVRRERDQVVAKYDALIDNILRALGGLSLLGSRPVGEAALSRKEGVEQAAAFLEEHGYRDMAPSYFLEGDGILTVHFAPVLDGVYCYPDLVKVGVALDNGDVVSFEAHAT